MVKTMVKTNIFDVPIIKYRLSIKTKRQSYVHFFGIARFGHYGCDSTPRFGRSSFSLKIGPKFLKIGIFLSVRHFPFPQLIRYSPYFQKCNYSMGTNFTFHAHTHTSEAERLLIKLNFDFLNF